MKTKIVYICFFLWSIGAAKAQWLSGNAFLKGRFVECALASNGTLGSGMEAPAGYHSLSGGKTPAPLALVVDVGKDGWDKGNPKWIGDFILPGLPHEGWDLEVNGFTARAMRSKGDRYLSFGLSGMISGYKQTGSSIFVSWTGALGNIAIEKEMSFDTSRMFLLFRVKLINRGSTALHKIYYQRTVDPDNEYEQLGGTGYATIEEIEHCQPDTAHQVSVSAKGHDFGSYMGLLTRDCRAKAYYLKSSLVTTESLDSFYSGIIDTNLIQFRKGIDYFYDVGMGLIFNVGTLNAGDSTLLTYAYVFEKGEQNYLLQTAFQPELQVKGRHYRDGDTVYACNEEWIDLSIFAAGHDYWRWSTPFVDSQGRANRILVHDTMRVSLWRPYAASCGGGKYDSVRITIVGTIPHKLVLYRSGNLLTIPAGFTKGRWYRNGLLLADTGSTYEIKYNGIYQAQAQDSNGCWVSSEEINETGMRLVESKHQLQMVHLYPNPVQGVLYLDSAVPMNIRVLNTLGQELVRAENALSVDMKSLVDGLYLIYLYDLDGSPLGIQRVIKCKE